MPRRKYGHLVKPHQSMPREKCRYCRLGWPCPVHGGAEAAEARRARAADVRRTKEARKAAKGR